MSFVVTPGDTLTAIPVPLSQGGTSTDNAATARTNLGATTVGANLFTLSNPSALTFPQLNADNTVSALGAAAFRSAIGAGSVTSVAASAGTGISITGSPITGSGTLGITNTGVTSLTAGSGISLSGSTGSVTVSASGSSAMTLISTATASSSSAIVFTGLNFSTYKEYMIILSNVVPSTAGASIGVQLSQNNGASYPSGSFSYYYNVLRLLGTYNCSRGYNTNMLLDVGISNTSSRGGMNCNLYLNSLINTAYNAIYMTGAYEDQSQSNVGVVMQGFCLDLTASVNAIQFIPAGGGTIASGTFKLYGIT